MMKNATYSEDFKEQALKKVFSRGQRTIRSIADELNLPKETLRNWMKKTLSDPEPRRLREAQRPHAWTLAERFEALQESHGLSGDALNAWCRERGVFAHQLAAWKAAFCQPSKPVERREEAAELRALKAENLRLERELKRKEKALAEAAALLVLQKKSQALWEGEGE